MSCMSSTPNSGWIIIKFGESVSNSDMTQSVIVEPQEKSLFVVVIAAEMIHH